MFKKTLILGFIISIIFYVLPVSNAKADVLSDLSSGITDIVRIINLNIRQIKFSFCANTFIFANSQNTSSIFNKIQSTFCKNFSNDVFSSSIKRVTTIDFPKINTPQVSENNNPDGLINSKNISGQKLDSNEVIYYSNLERKNSGIGLINLSSNKLLGKVAEARVNDMFEKVYFEHTSPTGDNASKEAQKFGYKYITVGENIALGNFLDSKDLVLAWMNSPSHKANILNKNYKEIGVFAKEGIYNGDKVWIAVQIFGRPISDCNEPDPKLKSKIEADKSYALKIDEQLKTIQAGITSVIGESAYNQKVVEYNNLTEEYNATVTGIKTMITEYNKQVESFNICIKSVQ